jgi:hypothetical protein
LDLRGTTGVWRKLHNEELHDFALIAKSRAPPKYIKIEIHKTIFLPVVLYGLLRYDKSAILE